MELLIDNYHPYFRLFLLNDWVLWNLRNSSNESSDFTRSLHRACAACWARVCSLNRYGFNSHTEVVKPVALSRTKVYLTERWRMFKGKLNSASCSGQTLGCSGLQAFTSGALLTQTLFDFIFNYLFGKKQKTKQVLEPIFRRVQQVHLNTWNLWTKRRHSALLGPSRHIYVYTAHYVFAAAKV